MHIRIFLVKKESLMEWGEAIEFLVRYFRVEDHNVEDSVCEIIIDEHLELKIAYLDGRFLVFWGYFAGEITENDLPKLKNILQWNFARIMDTDDILSIESESNRLCLFRKRSLAELFTDNLFGEMESFVANLAFWADAFNYVREVPRGSNLTIFGV
ncbi:MAG: CesT family type III secretion system chaperone [Puniceicoccales bacterium]|nr:CesT family type III secretion system chaperone [Puniceicoccales bacterium]